MSKGLANSLFTVLLSGILGWITGNVATSLGLSHTTAYTWAGFMGFMSGNAVQYVVLLFSYRYSKVVRVRIKMDN